MNGDNMQDLFEQSFHRKLTPEEEAQLAARFAENPGDAEKFEEDIALNSLLRQIPDASLSSNFTARVLQSIASPPKTPVKSSIWSRLKESANSARIVKWAAACSLALFTGIAYKEYVQFNRQEVARAMAEVSTIATLPSLEILENFEAILRLDQIPQKSDDELLAALQ